MKKFCCTPRFEKWSFWPIWRWPLTLTWNVLWIEPNLCRWTHSGAIWVQSVGRKKIIEFLAYLDLTFDIDLEFSLSWAKLVSMRTFCCHFGCNRSVNEKVVQYTVWKIELWPIWPRPLTLVRNFLCIKPSKCRYTHSGAIWMQSVSKWQVVRYTVWK